MLRKACESKSARYTVSRSTTGIRRPRRAFRLPCWSLKARIIDADGLLLVTPEYNNGVPGVFKSAVDWLSRADRKAVFGERLVGLMGASMGGFGTLSSQHAWLPTLKALGARVYSGGMMLLSRAHTVFDAEGHLSHEDAQKMLTEYLAGYAAFVQTHRRDG